MKKLILLLALFAGTAFAGSSQHVITYESNYYEGCRMLAIAGPYSHDITSGEQYYKIVKLCLANGDVPEHVIHYEVPVIGK